MYVMDGTFKLWKYICMEWATIEVTFSVSFSHDTPPLARIVAINSKAQGEFGGVDLSLCAHVGELQCWYLNPWQLSVVGKLACAVCVLPWGLRLLLLFTHNCLPLTHGAVCISGWLRSCVLYVLLEMLTVHSTRYRLEFWLVFTLTDKLDMPATLTTVVSDLYVHNWYLDADLWLLPSIN